MYILIVFIALIFLIAVAFGIYAGVLSHEQKIAPTLTSDGIRVACVGNSITFGQGVVFSRSRGSYPAQLQQMLGTQYQVLNYGVMSTSLSDTSRHPYTSSDFYAMSLKCEPDYVVIMLGTNDSWQDNWNQENYSRQLRVLVQEYQDLHSSPKVVLLTPFFASTIANTEVIYVDTELIENEIAPTIFEIAQEMQTGYIDIFTMSKGHNEYLTIDGTHPNFEGNNFIAKNVFAWISSTDMQ